MALIVTFQNDGTGPDDAANYKVEVLVNSRVIHRTRIEGHNRADEWQELVRRLVERDVVRCDDCNLPYRAFPLDLTLPHDQWALIHPERDGGGVLCAFCIVQRASKLPGAIAVRATIERGSR